MIMIYSAEGDKLFTDPKKHFYIDSEILRDRAAYSKINYTLDQIAIAVGYRNFSEMDCFLRCSGFDPDAISNLILSGKLAEVSSNI